MIKVFISQPMQNRQQEVILRERKAIEVIIKTMFAGKMYTLLTPLFKEQKMQTPCFVLVIL